MVSAALTSKGQITIPKPIRTYLNVSAGDKVEFSIDEDGEVIITAKTLDVKDIFGSIKAKSHVSISTMNKGIQQAVSERFKKHECD